MTNEEDTSGAAPEGAPGGDATAAPSAADQSTTGSAVRIVLIGAIAVLIGALLVAVGYLGALAFEEESAPQVVREEATPAPVLAPRTGPGATSQVDFLLLDEILQVLEEDFVEPDRVDAEYLHSAAINGMLGALDDPHSTYIDPETYALSGSDFDGVFQGIGATVEKPDGSDYVVIVRPLPDTPAEAAGIRAGDTILEVDGESAFGWSLQQAVLRIRGPQGTPVELTVRRTDGEEERITIVRDEITITSVSMMSPQGPDLLDADGEPVTDVGYIRILSFARNTPQELREAVDQAEAGGVSGLILDLRSNLGGLLIETTEVADMFLEDGIIFVEVDRNGVERVTSARPGQVTELPIVLLQDDFSASGAELLAAALSDNERALVLGITSFGKGTVSHARELSNGGALYVSIARWLTPNRDIIEGLGVVPDIVVEFTIEDIEAERDVQIERAIDVLRDLVDQASAAP